MITPIADSSFVVAVFNPKDPKHEICAAYYARLRSKILLPQSTVAEVGYLLTQRMGNVRMARFLRSLAHPTLSKYTTIPLQDEDFVRTADILEKYADARLDFVDASLVAIAERLHIPTILTLDQRDFQMVRPTHVSALDLHPSLN